MLPKGFTTNDKDLNFRQPTSKQVSKNSLSLSLSLFLVNKKNCNPKIN